MYIADLHIHSKYSYATSRDCDAPHLDMWARRKGVHLIGTGDFTHPAWRAELRDALVPAEEGLYRLRGNSVLPAEVALAPRNPRFVVSGEISTIYKKEGKARRVHHLVLLPGLEDAQRLSRRLDAIGNLAGDGRPILNLDSRDLLEMTLCACPEAMCIPAHIWTPHFSVLGNFSGFGSLEQCYGDMTVHVHAVETGLSSDPPMNRLVSMLDGMTLISNSDAHSPRKLGREANVLHGEMSYPALKRAIETGEGLAGTIEFFPEEGKYFLDGHRACGVCMTADQTARANGICPVCGRKVSIGVMNRLSQCADRAQQRPDGKWFESLIPLEEVLAGIMGLSSASKKVQAAYLAALKRFGPEMHILRALPEAEMTGAADFAALGEALLQLRAGNVVRTPGYDGKYGLISLPK